MKKEKSVSDTRKIISSRIALAREQAGLTQAQAARELKLPRPSISEIEAGRRRVAADELVAISKLYRVSVSWLAGEDAEEVNPAQDKLLLAARAASKLNPDDLKLVLQLLSSLDPGGKK